MDQFFIEASSVKDNRITVTGPDVNHIANVLRMRRGEAVQLVEQVSGLTYTCTIDEINPESVVCVIDDVQSESRELPVKITLYQGLPKSDKLEFVIQKAVEMGACRIVPVAMKRSVVKLSAEKADRKLSRWNSIAVSAASQSKRGMIPEVASVMTYEEAVRDASSCDAVLLPYELASTGAGGEDAGSGDQSAMDRTREILADLKAQGVRSIAIFIGPEGGFDISEVERAREAGAHIITLGNRILRTETAPIAILAWLTYIFEE